MLNSSLLIPPSYDAFRISIDERMFLTPISEKYNNVIAQRNMQHRNISDLIQATIQSVVPPTFGLSNVNQTLLRKAIGGDVDRYQSVTIDYRNIQELKNTQELTVTFVHTDAFFTYMYMLESMLHFKKPNIIPHGVIGDITLYILDSSNDNVIFTIVLSNCIISNITELNLSYTNITREFNTFDVGFEFDSFRVIFNTPEMIRK